MKIVAIGSVRECSNGRVSRTTIVGDEAVREYADTEDELPARTVGAEVSVVWRRYLKDDGTQGGSREIVEL